MVKKKMFKSKIKSIYVSRCSLKHIKKIIYIYFLIEYSIILDL